MMCVMLVQGSDSGRADHASVNASCRRTDEVGTAERLGGPLVATGTALTMAVVVPALFIFGTPNPIHPTWFGTLLIVIGSACRYAWIVGSGQRRLIEIYVWLFVYVFLGLAPLVQLREGVEPSTTKGLEAAMNGRALWIVALGSAAFGCGLLVGRLRTPTTTPTSARESRVSGPKLMTLSLAGLLAWGYFVSKVGAGALFSSRGGLGAAAAAAWPVNPTQTLMTAAASMPLLVAFVGLLKLRQQRAHEGRPRPFFLPVLVGAALLVTINPITSARYVFGTAFLAILSVLGMYATPGRFRFIALALVAALILLFPIAGAYRYTSTAVIGSSSPAQALTGGDFDSFAQISNTALYVERHGVTYGRQALGVALFWVPRSIWADKPVDTGILLAEFRGYRFTNLSAPLWAELYINGGWLLLIIGMGALGRAAWQLDSKIAASLRKARAPGVLACILPSYLILVLRGSLLQSMAYFTVIAVSALFIRERCPKPPIVT